MNAILVQTMCDTCLPAADQYGCASATNHITSKDKLICEVLQGRSVLVPYKLWNWSLAAMVSMNS